MTIGERVKQRREELRLSQTELAERMGYADKSAVSKMESSGDSFSIMKLRKLSKALTVPISYFTEGDMSSSSLSSRAQCVAYAYERASERTKVAVEVALGLDFGGDE